MKLNQIAGTVIKAVMFLTLGAVAAFAQSVPYEVDCAISSNHEENIRCTDENLPLLGSAIRNSGVGAVATPDIILKFQLHLLYSDSKVTLTAYTAEDNNDVWTETRSVISLDNDVARLVKHYKATVDKAKYEARLCAGRNPLAWLRTTTSTRVERIAQWQTFYNQCLAESQ